MTIPDRDAGLRHVNERQAGDPRPDRSYCLHCGRVIERLPGQDDWTTGLIGLPGTTPECPAAPVPDDGPYPNHQPKDVIVHPPKEQ